MACYEKDFNAPGWQKKGTFYTNNSEFQELN